MNYVYVFGGWGEQHHQRTEQLEIVLTNPFVRYVTNIIHMKLKSDGWDGRQWKIHKNNSFNNISKNHMFA